MKYLDKIYFGEPCNYEMAFYEYTKQMKNSSMQKFDRQIAMKAMEHLEASSINTMSFNVFLNQIFVFADFRAYPTGWRDFIL